MKNWKMKIIQFMNGRYGIDELNKSLFIISFILDILASLFRSNILFVLSIIGISLTLYRICSKDICKRISENNKFLKIKSSTSKFVLSNIYFNFLFQKYKYRDTHKIYLCKCRKYIRVPKGKGKIEVTCPNCGIRKIHKT